MRAIIIGIGLVGFAACASESTTEADFYLTSHSYFEQDAPASVTPVKGDCTYNTDQTIIGVVDEPGALPDKVSTIDTITRFYR